MKNWNVFAGLKILLIGRARELDDERLFHKVSLIAIIAWVGLGADGLSSSCYGPEETFKALGSHMALAPFVAIAAVITIAVICASYSQIIELFPGGGGGYLVASKLLSPTAGVVSGCALLVDYVLTISISIASGADALFSILPAHWHIWKIPFAIGGILVLTLLNLRGVREAVMLWVPVFFIFLTTHAFAIVYGFAIHAGDIPQIISETTASMKSTHSELGWLGMFLLLVRAYSVGAGTYTGIEAVSNGLPILREPRVTTAKRTMMYMGFSLALTVAGLLFAYLLFRVIPQEGKTLNSVLFSQITASWPHGAGTIFVSVAMLSATALLFIAAQAGFLDGPRVLANMALDRWFPARFATLSDRFVAQNGIMLMGMAASVVLLLTRGSVALLVVLYSINVFITFTLSQMGMVRHWWTHRGTVRRWPRKLLINSVGFFLTFSILVMLIITKFWEGGWVTLLITSLFILMSILTKRHYVETLHHLARLDDLVTAFVSDVPSPPVPPPPFNPNAKTAVVMVNGFNGLGVHTLLAIRRLFPDVFKSYVFVQAGIVDAGNFKGSGELDNLRRHIENETARFVDHMKRQGCYAEAATDIGTDIVVTACELADRVSKRFPNAVFFGGQLVFARESRTTRILHNFVVFALQREFFRRGISFLIVPIRVNVSSAKMTAGAPPASSVITQQ